MGGILHGKFSRFAKSESVRVPLGSLYKPIYGLCKIYFQLRNSKSVVLQRWAKLLILVDVDVDIDNILEIDVDLDVWRLELKY